jgi:hypothetical protein
MLFDQGAMLGARGIDLFFRLAEELGRSEGSEVEARGGVVANDFPDGQRNLHFHPALSRLKNASVEGKPYGRGALEKLFVEAEVFAVNEGGAGGQWRG